jgi:AraC family transcriptional regulator
VDSDAKFEKEDRQAERLATVVLSSLDAETGTGDLARRAYRSRTQFYRLFQALLDENPGNMRRRLLLERAAWQLARTRQHVTEIALDANYGSLEAFTRAFRKAFGLSPSLYRRSGASRIHLSAPNHYHFRPPGDSPKGASTCMDLFDLFAGADSWHTRRLLEQAAALSDEQLDRHLKSPVKSFGWCKPDQNLREILERLVQTKEVWVAALTGDEAPALEDRPAEDRTPAALDKRFERADAEFHRILSDVRDRGAWDETFVDALCEPAETFTYGGMFAHIITFNTQRRLSALDAFHHLGVKVQGVGCPTEYEAAMAAKHSDQSPARK